MFAGFNMAFQVIAGPAEGRLQNGLNDPGQNLYHQGINR
jgi:hypothetical protein